MPPTWHGYTWINGVVPGHSYSVTVWLGPGRVGMRVWVYHPPASLAGG